MFANRKEGGEKLGEALVKYKNKDVIVLGIPRGGVEPAYYVAKALNCELGILIARKLGHPLNAEVAFGAIAEDGSIYIHRRYAEGVTEEETERIVEAQKVEIERRIVKLRNGKRLDNLEGRIVILVDDGIATGATLFAAIQMCKNLGAGKIIVAVPVGHDAVEHDLLELVDEVVILEKPEPFAAVSQGYENFSNQSDEEAIGFLLRWQMEHKE